MNILIKFIISIPLLLLALLFFLIGWQEITNAIATGHWPLYEVAEYFGISETTNFFVFLGIAIPFMVFNFFYMRSLRNQVLEQQEGKD